MNYIEYINEQIYYVIKAREEDKKMLLDEMKRELKRINLLLTPFERKVMYRRMYKRMTLDETGKELGVTRERIRQIENEVQNRIYN